MRILLVCTGGTIGCIRQNGVLTPDPDTVSRLTAPYRKEGIAFDTVIPFLTLSENLNGDHLNQLVDCIDENLKKGYDGMIVTHGSDTVSFTAAALGFRYQNTLPIALVTAQYPLSHPDTNGFVNFGEAVALVRERQKGVFVPYRNQNGEIKRHIGTEIYRFGEQSAQMESGKGGHAENVPAFVKSTRFSQRSGVQIVTPAPGNDYRLDPMAKAVLCTPYHSATLPTADQNFREFCLLAKQNGVPVLVSQTVGDTPYASQLEFENLGITALPYPADALYMKLWYIHSAGEPETEVYNLW